MFGRITAGASRYFGRQQIHDDTVLVGGPDFAILAKERGTGTFFPAKSI